MGATYEAEVAEHGYATPDRVAQALWSKMPDLALTPILDYGCGTGLSGVALRKAGFEVIDGMDPTRKDAERRAAKGCVPQPLKSFEITEPAPLTPGAYAAITAIGVIGSGAAPPETLDMLMNALPKGGKLAFSFNDHTLADHSYTGD